MKRTALPLTVLALSLAGCTGVQSALDAAGAEAERIQTLSWVLFAFCGAVFLLVLVLSAIALLGGEGSRRKLAGEGIVVWLGIAFPVVSLGLLLGYGVAAMAKQEAAPPGAPVDILVTGERWWWRVEYRDEGGATFAGANELLIPTGRPVRVALQSADVIHSFWVPRLAGKLDMIPGRTNVKTLHATQPGASRGQCAEYCGGAHALMSFWVVALDEEEYRARIAHEAGPAIAPQTPQQQAGLEVFLASGCGGCHAIRGTQAAGTIGPDLTHVGSRRSLAAGVLENDAAAFARFVRDNQHVKPGNLMPPYEILAPEELSAVAAYLDSLE